jgi:hypothetical protein
MLTFKQYLLIEQDNKDPVKPSPRSADAAIKFGELSPEYAPFLDIENMSDQDIVDTYTKYSKRVQTPNIKELDSSLAEEPSGKWIERMNQMLDDLLRKAGGTPDDKSMIEDLLRDTEKNKVKSFMTDTERKANLIKDYLKLDRQELAAPIGDVTKLKDKPIFSSDFHAPRDRWLSTVWDIKTGNPTYGTPEYVPQGPMSPDLRGIYDPEPLRSIVKDSQGNAIPGPVIEPKRIEISPEATKKVKVAIDPNRVARELENQWGNNFLKQIQQNWEKENAAAELELKLKKENPILQMQDLIKQSDMDITYPGDLDLDDWPKVYDKFETKLPLAAAAPSKSANTLTMAGKQVAGKVLKAAGAVGDFMDPPASIASRGLGSLSTALGAGTEVASGMAMAPLAIGMFTQDAGDAKADATAWLSQLPQEQRDEIEKQQKQRNAEQIQNLINQGYNPSRKSARERTQ